MSGDTFFTEGALVLWLLQSFCSLFRAVPSLRVWELRTVNESVVTDSLPVTSYGSPQDPLFTEIK